MKSVLGRPTFGTLLCLTLFTASATAQAPDAPSDSLEVATDSVDTPEERSRDDGLRPYEEVLPPSVESDEGFLTVHRRDEDLLFEIPLPVLGRDLLIQTRITRAPSGMGYGGQRESMGVVRWERRANRVLLRMVGYRNVAPDSLPIFEAVRNSNFEPILFSFDVETMPADSSSVVIDVSDFFTADTPIIGLNQGRREDLGIRGLSRDRTFIESARSFPENVEIRRTVTFSVGGNGGSQSTGGAVSMELGHSLLLLPENPMERRPWDERVGYASVRQNDFGSDEQQLSESRFIRRWRLEPSDPAAYARGELVDPVQPIVYYIDPATPELWRPYLKEGVEAWQVAFEEAGFRNAIIVRDPPTEAEDPEFDPADARYSIIRYLASPVENASGPSFFDPRTGEILGAHVQWHHNVLNLVRKWYFVQTAAANPEARSVQFEDEVMGSLLRFVATHEVGHTLGLPHNMKGHSAVPVERLRTRWVCENGTSSSIMDYARFNYVAQPGDDTCFLPRIGVYDRWAIEYGYRVIPSAKTTDETRMILREWIEERADDPAYRFGDPSSFDPSSTNEALGDDPVRASDLGIANLERVAANLRDWTFEDGEDYDELEELYGEVLDQWREYVRHVTLLVGGVDWTRRAQGQDGRPYAPVLAERQREAVGWLDRQVFRTPHWLIDSEILFRIEPTGIQDRIRGLQSSALNQVLNVDRMKRVIEQETLGGHGAYGLGGLFSDLRRAVWTEIDDGALVDPFRRNLQRSYLERMGELMEDDEARASDIVPLVRGELGAVRSGAASAAANPPDEVTRLHLQDVVARIDEMLDPGG